jgi:hypothetical protein
MADTIAISKSDIGGMREFSGSRPFHMPGPTLSQRYGRSYYRWGTAGGPAG